MASAQSILSDPNFQQLPEVEKIKVMDKVDPNFKKLTVSEKIKVFSFAGKLQFDEPLYSELGLPVGKPEHALTAINAPFVPLQTVLNAPGAVSAEGLAADPGQLEQKGASILDFAEMGGQKAAKELGGFMPESGDEFSMTPELGGKVARLGGELAAYGPYTRGVIKLGGGLGNIVIDFAKAIPEKSFGKYIVDTLPKRLYGSAIKTPLSKKWTKVMPGKEISKRTAVIEEGLRSRVPPSDYGLAKAKGLEEEVRGVVDSIVDELTINKSNNLNTKDVLQSGLKKAYERASNSSDPVGAAEIVDGIAERFKGHGGVLTPKKANAIKRQLYREIGSTKYGGSESVGLQGDITTTAKKGVAHDIMTRLEDLHPDLKGLNATDGARVGLIEALENSVGRIGNTNILPLGTKILFRPNLWPVALWDATVGHPQIKTRIAFALVRANPKKYGKAFNFPKEVLSPKHSGKLIEYKPYYSSELYTKSKMDKAKLTADLARTQPPGEGVIPLASDKKGMPLQKPEGATAKSVIPKTFKVGDSVQSLRPEQVLEIRGLQKKIETGKVTRSDHEKLAELLRISEKETLQRPLSSGKIGQPLIKLDEKPAKSIRALTVEERLGKRPVVMIDVEIKVKETGETVKLKAPSDKVLSELNDKMSTFNSLKDALK